MSLKLPVRTRFRLDKQDFSQIYIFSSPLQLKVDFQAQGGSFLDKGGGTNFGF